MMTMMMNCFYGMVDRRKALSLISIQDHCQSSSTSRNFDTPRARFEPAQNLSSGLVKWSCAVAIDTTTRPRDIFFFIGASFWSMLFTVVLSITKENWENLDKGLSNSRMKMLLEKKLFFMLNNFQFLFVIEYLHDL